MRERRVLLLALSGVRVRNEALLRAGMTLPGFVRRSKVVARLPSLGLLTLAGLCPPGWLPVYREQDELPPDAADRIVREGFDLVAVSSLSARILEAYALADALRARGARVVLGGLHVTALPREAARHADAVVVGEGEPVWADLLHDCGRGRLRPRYRSRKGPDWEAPAGLPRYDLLDPADYNRPTLQTMRGCLRRCVFCAASRSLGPFRLKPISRVRRELEALLERWPRPFLELADDNTFADRRWSRELLGLLGGYGLRWFTETDISVADDPGLLDLLARAGCVQLLIGLESPSPESLAGLDFRDWKRRQAAEYPAKIARIQSRGVAVNGCFILGLDSDGPGVFAKVARFVRETGLAEAQITMLTPFPGTCLYARLKAEGRLAPEPFWDRLTLFDRVHAPGRMSASELEGGFLDLMRRLYSRPEVSRRNRVIRDCRRTVRRRYGGGTNHV